MGRNTVRRRPAIDTQTLNHRTPPSFVSITLFLSRRVTDLACVATYQPFLRGDFGRVKITHYVSLVRRPTAPRGCGKEVPKMKQGYVSQAAHGRRCESSGKVMSAGTFRYPSATPSGQTRCPGHHSGGARSLTLMSIRTKYFVLVSF